MVLNAKRTVIMDRTVIIPIRTWFSTESPKIVPGLKIQVIRKHKLMIVATTNIMIVNLLSRRTIWLML